MVFDEGTRPSRRLRLAMHTYPEAFVGLKDPTLVLPYQQNHWWLDRAVHVSTVPTRFDDITRVWMLEYKDAGQLPDEYDLSELTRLGFSITHTFDEHTSVIYEMQKT